MDALVKQLNDYKQEMEAYTATDAQGAEAFRIKYLGTKGLVKNVMGEMKHVPAEQRKEAGQLLNEFKQAAESKYELLKKLAGNGQPQATAAIDLSLPGDPVAVGTRHPISLVRNRIISIFHRLGFAVAEGPRSKTTGTTLPR